MILFLIQAYAAWSKYSRKDTMMVSKLLETEKRTFPSVTLCKGPLPGVFNGTIEEAYEYNANLDNWLKASTFDSEPL